MNKQNKESKENKNSKKLTTKQTWVGIIVIVVAIIAIISLVDSNDENNSATKQTSAKKVINSSSSKEYSSESSNESSEESSNESSDTESSSSSMDIDTLTNTTFISMQDSFKDNDNVQVTKDNTNHEVDLVISDDMGELVTSGELDSDTWYKLTGSLDDNSNIAQGVTMTLKTTSDTVLYSSYEGETLVDNYPDDND